MSDFDQYQDPLAELEIDPGAQVFQPVEPRQVPVRAVLDWLQQAADRFGEQPGLWLKLAAVYTVVGTLIALILVVQFSVAALWPMVLGGLILGLAAAERGGELELSHLWAGFSQRYFTPLLLLGLSYMLAAILLCVSLVGMVAVGYGLVWLIHTPIQALIGPSVLVDTLMATFVAGAIIFIGLLFLAVLIAAATVIWFAVPLVVLRAYTPMAAVRCSWQAVRLNRLPLALLGLVAAVLTVLSVMSLLLGFLLWLPMWWNTIYIAYKDIFQPAPENAAV